MDHFNYKNKTLFAENTSISKIASQIGTPFYCYSHATISRHYKVFSEAFKKTPTTVCFAVKSNSNLTVLNILAKLGAGADTVSEGEIRRSIKAGIPAKKIVFSGVGKTKDEMRYALSVGIGQFNIESFEELDDLNEVAIKMGLKAPVTFRVNPDIEAGTHDKISTGRKTDKFGVAWDKSIEIYKQAKEMQGINVIGIACHIGSQLTSLDPFKDAFKKLVTMIEELKENGHNIKTIDLGGGLGIPYESNTEPPPAPKDYADMIVETIKHLGCELILEPGRLIVGNAGILVSKVIRTKDTDHKNFVIIDAAMNDLARPSLYGAYHEIIPVKEPKDTKTKTIDLVGPICETGDTFGKDYELPPLKADDLIAMRSAGAYGAVMSSTYNSRLLVPEVLVKGDQYTVIRPRQTYDELLGLDRILI